jgi:peptidoglycan-N-acetylglucosamine deacetylase
MLKPKANQVEYRFPKALKKAVVMSYDDGSEHDRRLVGIFNTYGVRGTFHLNSSRLGNDYHIKRDEVGTLYRGHEVSCHTRNHRELTALADHDARMEIETDKRDLESLAGYTVRGLAYPFGAYDDRIVSLVSELGMTYARTAEDSHAFGIPEDVLRLSTTCHHNRMAEFAARLLDSDEPGLELMIVWGHSFELNGFMSSDPDKDWNYMEGVCRHLYASSAIWFATMVEVLDYLEALRLVDASRLDERISNPSALPIWLRINGRDVELPPRAAIDLTGVSEASGAGPTW